jgi:hypothetical protein
MGHSLGEYGALVASGAMPFGDALKAVSARGSEMTKVSMEDNGLMAACFGPLEEIEKIMKDMWSSQILTVTANPLLGGERRQSKKQSKRFGKLVMSPLNCRSATLSIPGLWLRPANRWPGF